jgi:hypothetical protein
MTQTNGHDPVAAANALARAREATLGEELTFSGWTRDEATVLLRKVGVWVEAQVKPLREEIAALKAQIKELEQRKFCGVFQRALSYKSGSQVTFHNGLWIAITDVEPNECPGQSLKWQLALRHVDQPRAPTKGGPHHETIIHRRT